MLAASRRKRTRSVNGCWTCRIRRKKCDEGRPTCTLCTSLNLTCQGYGEKPIWMDGGVREYSYIQEVKKIVHECMSERKRRRSSKSKHAIEPSSTCNPSPESSIAAIDHSMSQNDDDYAWLPIDEFTSELSFEIGKEMFTSPQVSYCDGWDSSHLQMQSYPEISPATSGEYLQSDFSATSPSRNKNVIQHTVSGLELSSNTTDLDSCVGILPSSEQSIAVLHYLEYGFTMQFPATRILPERKAHLLDLLLRSEPFRLATTALSYEQMNANHITSRDSCGSSPIYCAYLKMVDHTAKCFSTYLDMDKVTYGVDAGIELLSCVLQLIYVEHGRDDCKAWMLHLRAAASIVNLLHTHQQAQLASVNVHLTAPSNFLTTNHTFNSSQASFLVAAYITFDIISAASLQTDHILEDHKLLISEYATAIEHNTGYSAEILLAIFDTSRLALWKQTMVEEKTLDVMELAGRAVDIRTRLQECLSRYSEIHKLQLSHCDDKYDSENQDDYSPIFAHAALIYLSVVVSGAHVRVPHLQDHITCILELISRRIATSVLPSETVLSCIVWPFCMAGCLAVPEHYDTFRKLGQTTADYLDNDTSRRKTPVGKALDIMEFCWQARMRDPDVEADWVYAMNALKLKTVLL